MVELVARRSIQNMMDDPTREDFGIRIGRSHSLNIRAGLGFAEHFPDGVDVEVIKSRDSGDIQLHLRNRATGSPVRKQDVNGRKYIEVGKGMGTIKGADLLPFFAATAPEQWIKTQQGFIAVLPPTEQLQPPQLRKKGKRVSTQFKTPKPVTVKKADKEVALKPEKPVDPVVAKAAEVKVAPAVTLDPATFKPVEVKPITAISLREAVAALNAHKDALGEALNFVVTGEGKIRAAVVYG